MLDLEENILSEILIMSYKTVSFILYMNPSELKTVKLYISMISFYGPDPPEAKKGIKIWSPGTPGPPAVWPLHFCPISCSFPRLKHVAALHSPNSATFYSIFKYFYTHRSYIYREEHWKPYGKLRMRENN